MKKKRSPGCRCCGPLSACAPRASTTGKTISFGSLRVTYYPNKSYQLGTGPSYAFPGRGVIEVELNFTCAGLGNPGVQFTYRQEFNLVYIAESPTEAVGDDPNRYYFPTFSVSGGFGAPISMTPQPGATTNAQLIALYAAEGLHPSQMFWQLGVGSTMGDSANAAASSCRYPTVVGQAEGAPKILPFREKDQFGNFYTWPNSPIVANAELAQPYRSIRYRGAPPSTVPSGLRIVSNSLPDLDIAEHFTDPVLGLLVTLGGGSKLDGDYMCWYTYQEPVFIGGGGGSSSFTPEIRSYGTACFGGRLTGGDGIPRGRSLTVGNILRTNNVAPTAAGYALRTDDQALAAAVAAINSTFSGSCAKMVHNYSGSSATLSAHYAGLADNTIEAYWGLRLTFTLGNYASYLAGTGAWAGQGPGDPALWYAQQVYTPSCWFHLQFPYGSPSVQIHYRRKTPQSFPGSTYADPFEQLDVVGPSGLLFAPNGDWLFDFFQDLFDGNQMERNPNIAPGLTHPAQANVIREDVVAPIPTNKFGWAGKYTTTLNANLATMQLF